LAEVTDPARELAELCDRLKMPNDNKGDEWVAQVLGVEPWSREFYEAVFSVVERADFRLSLIDDLELDDDFKAQAASHVTKVKTAFNKHSLQNGWKQVGALAVSAENIQPIKMLSPLVRQKVEYPRLSDEERNELLADVDELLEWLREHQLKDRDFVRQALIEGLERFRFCLKRVGWLGWGYTLDSLREVIGAYMALERGLDPTTDPIADAALKKAGAFVKGFYDKTQVFKGVVETGDFLLRAYGAAALATTPAGLADFLLSG